MNPPKLNSNVSSRNPLALARGGGQLNYLLSEYVLSAEPYKSQLKSLEKQTSVRVIKIRTQRRELMARKEVKD